MRSPSPLLAILAASLFSCAAARASIDFIVTAHGSRTFQTTIKGKQVIVTQPVTNATFYQAFGVSAKGYQLVFNTAGAFELIPRQASGGPVFTVFSSSTNVAFYVSEAPSGDLSFANLISESDADATDFGGIQGVITEKVALPNGSPHGVSGTVRGAAVMNAPFYLYNLTYTGTKFFRQSM